MTAGFLERSAKAQKLCHDRWRSMGWKGGDHIPRVDPCSQACPLYQPCIHGNTLTQERYNARVREINKIASLHNATA